jgi:hypothetical protein
MNAGDSGRITNVGRTLAGTNLDLIYKVISTDESSWQAPKESPSDCPIGLAFTGEQNIANSDGNSIVALYYGANNVNLNYQIVIHNTNFQIPVLASFITTDIDMAQGVKNNLANLLTVIPKTTNLATDSSGVIYDTTSPDTDLNGQASLPYGGYLGVGFLSNFDYDFYSPAPARSGNSYQYSQGVRYDLFGSALQAHLTTQVRDIVYLNYYDADENNQLIVPQHQFIWFPNVSWNVPASKFPHYAYGQESQHRNGNTIIVGDYYHIQSTVTYDYYGMDGTYLGQQSTTGLYNKPYSVNVPYRFGNYYIEGSTTRSGLYPKTDETLDVYYKYVPPIVYYNTSNPYATTYYANGYEYVPNYIAPVVYYVPTYDSYGYGGGYSYSGSYAYSSGGYSNSSGAYYPNYVPQSAYYTKEAQLVSEDNYNGGGSRNGENWWADEGRDQVFGLGAEKFAQWGLMIGEESPVSPIVGPAITFGTELAKGKGIDDATAKSSAELGINLVVGGMATLAIAGTTALAPAIAIGVAAFIVMHGISIGYDYLYDHRRKRK